MSRTSSTLFRALTASAVTLLALVSVSTTVLAQSGGEEPYRDPVVDQARPKAPPTEKAVDEKPGDQDRSPEKTSPEAKAAAGTEARPNADTTPGATPNAAPNTNSDRPSAAARLRDTSDRLWNGSARELRGLDRTVDLAASAWDLPYLVDLGDTFRGTLDEPTNAWQLEDERFLWPRTQDNDVDLSVAASFAAVRQVERARTHYWRAYTFIELHRGAEDPLAQRALEGLVRMYTREGKSEAASAVEALLRHP